MAFVRIAGQLLHYRLAGRVGAPVLVLANSLGTDARIWDAVIERLGPDFHILSYDKRGHGLSDAPPGEQTLDEHVGDLEGLVAHLGFDRFVLAGVSVGGLIAQGYALRHPGKLLGLILMDTAARIGSVESWNARIGAVLGNGIASISDQILDRWFDETYRRTRPDDFAGWRHMLERTPAAGYAGTCAALRDADLRADVGRIATPALVLAGEKDVSTPPELVRETAGLIPNARFEMIPRAGHLPNIEQPDALVAAFRRYFAEIALG